MKRFLTLALVLLCGVLSALSLNPEEGERGLYLATHTSGNLTLDVSNQGTIENFTLANSGTSYLFKGASWVSGKRQRRDSVGRKLYWLVYPPTPENDYLTYEGAMNWTPSLVAVVDTLTSVGFDGDLDLYELLPAYNPLVTATIPPNPYYAQYNEQDIVLKSILGSPAPRPFAYPDLLGTYCFTIPQAGTFATPGFETLSGYYYDFCPFGTLGDRDYGANRTQSEHYPLGIALHRESYAWNLQNHNRMFILKTTIYNSSTLDTLFDLAISDYIDCDIKPSSWGPEGALDDVSGYVSGPGYEFAYSRDADGDGGLAPYLVGNKIILPGVNANHACWYWQVGDGPDDFYPRDMNYAPRRTANEKYWLTTGINPDQNKYMYLGPQLDIPQYEQPVPNDTRFLNTIYGDQPGTANPNRLNLAPGANISYYSVLLFGTDLEDLKSRCSFATTFINSGLQIGDTTGLTCIPYLLPLVYNPASFGLNWQSYTNPEHFEVKYKVYDAPASTWTAINLPGTARSHTLSGLDSNTWYQIKVASIYNPGPNEVYLESQTVLANLSYPTAADDPIQPPNLGLTNYPNPFNPSTSITFELKEAGFAQLTIYNTRGQLVRRLLQQNLPPGRQIQLWDGRDESGSGCGSGIYFLRLDTGRQSQTRKMLLLK